MATRTVEREVSEPDFVVRGKVNGFWQSFGVAFKADLGDKGEGLSVKLNSMPVGDWDGSFLLMPPLPREEVSKKK